MNKICCITICIALVLTSCRKTVPEKQEESIHFDNVPEYCVDEIELPDNSSYINYIGYDNDKLLACVSYEDEAVKIIERNILSNEIITEFDINSDIYNGAGEYFSHSYYERGVKYNELGERNSEIEVKSTGNNDVRNHNWVCGMHYSDNDTIIYLTVDVNKNYNVFNCDSDNKITSKNNIKIPDDYVLSDINYYNGKYYISAYQIEMNNGDKSYPSSVLIYDSELNFIEEIIDIDIEKIRGCINLDADLYAVYSYDENNNISYLELCDNDMSTVTEVKKYSGKANFFPSDSEDSVYATYENNIVLVNLVSDQIESIAEIQVENNKSCEVLFCDGLNYAYMVKNNDTVTGCIEIDELFEFNKSGDYKCFDFYFNSDDQYVARDFISDSETIIDGYDGTIPLSYYNNSFWGINSAGERVLFDLNGKNKTIYDKDKYVTETLLLGETASAICRKKEDYFFCMLNSETGITEKVIDINEKQYMSQADVYYPGDTKYAFFIGIDGYVLGFETEKEKFEPLLDLTLINNDSLVLAIRTISSGVFQLITENKVFRLTQTNEEISSKAEIVIGNLTFNNLYTITDVEKFDEYSFKIVDYIDKNTGEVDYSRLNQDIVNGKSPDIIVKSSGTDVTYLEKKSFFMQLNLSDILAQDKSYLENIITAFNEDEVYYIPDGFKIDTLMSSDETINLNWNYNDYLNMIKNNIIKEDAMVLFYNYFCLYYPECVKSNIKSLFSSEEFKNVLSIIKEYASDDSDVNMYELLHGTLIGADYFCEEDGIDYHICGYPSTDGGKSLIHADVVYAVSKASKYKKECTEFIKEAVSEAYGQSFSLEKEKFNDQINQLKAINDTKFVNDLQNIILNASVTNKTDHSINQIIEDEIFEYLENDDLTNAEVADQISNKIALYLDETA